LKYSIAAGAALFLSLTCFTAHASSVLAFNETAGTVYGALSGSITSGSGAADDLYFSAAVAGVDITVDLTNSAGIITDTLFSPSGMSAIYPGDAFEFAGFNSGNAAIGQTCVAATDVTCIVNTGSVIDLTSLFDSESVYGTFGGDLTIQATDGLAAVPEIDPTTGTSALALLACAVLIIRGRRTRKVQAV